MMKASSETLALVDGGEIHVQLNRYRELVEARLDELVPGEAVEPKSIHNAIRWSLFAGGKRLRPLLLLATGQEFGAGTDVLLDTACALELIHTYSLIHDDLPSMDDDDLRRGRPTSHIRFGEATAILAGDALQSLAFQTIALDEKLTSGIRVRLIAEVARASATPHGMIAGQAYDLAAESREVSGDELERIHRHKTGALIASAARSGAIIAGASETELEALTRYSVALGLLFQITDDLLDVTATAEDLGKTPGKDARSSKATYPALYGLDATRERAQAAYNEACLALDEIERPMPLLRAIAAFILGRRA
ncbi:MAG: geranylgeranyl diphosphate synthase, type [Acidobacteriota bacterium]|jgi:geranylgeranyl pyrophosphate synthase|nr:geranylgeranyl diphosphate synthase, type [Acidobacteriota bacterium]